MEKLEALLKSVRDGDTTRMDFFSNVAGDPVQVRIYRLTEKLIRVDFAFKNEKRKGS